MKDWRKRFRSFWTAINKDYELNFETGDDRRVSGEVEDFIFSVLTTQKESFIKIIESKRGEIYNDTVSEEYTRDEKQCYRQGASDYLTVVLAELERRG